MTLTEVIESWVRDAERMQGESASGVVVTEELFAHLLAEQADQLPTVAGLVPFVCDLSAHSVAVEIAGPDRVCVYLGSPPDESTLPLGLDPAMPVMFVPIPPHVLASVEQLEMYNRLRWYGLCSDEAMAGAG